MQDKIFRDFLKMMKRENIQGRKKPLKQTWKALQCDTCIFFSEHTFLCARKSRRDQNSWPTFRTSHKTTGLRHDIPMCLFPQLP